MVAEEFCRQMAAKGVTVPVHHIREAKPKQLAPADLYLFSSPARFGKPIGTMRRFLKKLELPAGTKYAILSTEAAPRAARSRTGSAPTRATGYWCSRRGGRTTRGTSTSTCPPR